MNKAWTRVWSTADMHPQHLSCKRRTKVFRKANSTKRATKSCNNGCPLGNMSQSSGILTGSKQNETSRMHLAGMSHLVQGSALNSVSLCAQRIVQSMSAAAQSRRMLILLMCIQSQLRSRLKATITVIQHHLKSSSWRENRQALFCSVPMTTHVTSQRVA